MEDRPHICPALKQVRAWVTLTALTLALCSLAQLFVFGCVHYTDVRWTTIERSESEAPLSVVISEERNAAARTDAKSDAPESASPVEAANPNRVLSSADGRLSAIASFAQGIGVVAGLALILLTALGTLIGAGAAVPGIEKSVTAAIWACVLGLLCVPWQDLLPSMVFKGVFTGYERLVAASEGLDAQTRSAGSALAQHFMLPVLVSGSAVMIALWFRAGVERGTIITAVSDLEDALEREMHDIRRRGVAASSPRSVGALNRALGDAPRAPGAPAPANVSMGPIPAVPSSAEEPMHLRAAAGAESMTGLSPSLARKGGRRPLQDDDDGRRPI